MERYSFKRDGKRFVRVTKSAARKAYEDGVPFIIIASKMAPDGAWGFGHMVSPLSCDPDYNFAALVNSFTVYNCSNETGRYPAFYMEAQK